MKNGAPSGPSTEIQLLTSQELIYHEDQSEAVKADASNHHVSFSTEDLHQSNKREKSLNSADINENIGEADVKDNSDENNEVLSEKSRLRDEEMETPDGANDESTLLSEVGKLLQARVSYSEEEKTSI